MPGSFKEPTHNRLIAAFKAVGPYVREEQCKEGYYMFDCLSVCINDKKSPEEREFWGWWMEVTKDGELLKGQTFIGRYDSEGKWVKEKPAAKAVDEVKRTHGVFCQKIEAALKDKFDLEATLDSL
ncbi:sigma factor-binding protein Crl [Vibrio sp.]|nr:sigma factor-binding protein Crl [Vibrio sp.]